MNRLAIEVESLSVRFGDFFALEGLTFTIPQNRFVAIVGPNGAGKSTLLKVLLGLVSPSDGSAAIFESSPGDVPANWVGYVPQAKTMDRSFPALSLELVLTGLEGSWPWRRKKTNYTRAFAALEQVGAGHLAERPLGRLSGGELQRVYLARSIVREPRVLVLDEPATGIDAVGEADMYRLLEDYQKRSGATFLMVTHDWHAATHHADFVLLLNRKQISFGKPSDALAEENLRLAFGHIGHEHALRFLRDDHG
jgi:zinc transport system ATP-binding protein